MTPVHERLRRRTYGVALVWLGATPAPPRSISPWLLRLVCGRWAHQVGSGSSGRGLAEITPGVLKALAYAADH